MASSMSQATLCSWRTASRSTTPPWGGVSSAGGANSIVARLASSSASTRRSPAPPAPKAASAAPPIPTRSRPRRRTAREAGPAPRSAAPTPTSAVSGTLAPSSLSGATAGGVRLGATSRGAPAVANTVIPWCASSDDASATRRPGSGWLISHAVVEPVPPCTHRTSVSSHGAATWTSACSMGTSQPAPTASQARAPPGAMSSRRIGDEVAALARHRVVRVADAQPGGGVGRGVGRRLEDGQTVGGVG